MEYLDKIIAFVGGLATGVAVTASYYKSTRTTKTIQKDNKVKGHQAGGDINIGSQAGRDINTGGNASRKKYKK